MSALITIITRVWWKRSRKLIWKVIGATIYFRRRGKRRTRRTSRIPRTLKFNCSIRIRKRIILCPQIRSSAWRPQSDQKRKRRGCRDRGARRVANRIDRRSLGTAMVRAEIMITESGNKLAHPASQSPTDQRTGKCRTIIRRRGGHWTDPKAAERLS